MSEGLLGPVEVRNLAHRLGIRPTKARGQNFVHDANTVRRIVRAAELKPSDVVLEVGPGLGSLTLGLLPAVNRVVAIEIDRGLATALPSIVDEREPRHRSKLTVVTGNALHVQMLPDPQPTTLVANLPYNVAVPVLLHLLALLPSLRSGLVMVQAEVADRLVAHPGSKIYGAPSVKLAWFAAAQRAGHVPRTVFWPMPNVDSQLVMLTRRQPPSSVPREAVFAVIDAAFSQRRKTLRASLAAWAGSSARAEKILRQGGIDPAMRAESLDVASYAHIVAASDLIPHDA